MRNFFVFVVIAAACVFIEYVVAQTGVGSLDVTAQITPTGGLPEPGGLPELGGADGGAGTPSGSFGSCVTPASSPNRTASAAASAKDWPMGTGQPMPGSRTGTGARTRR